MRKVVFRRVAAVVRGWLVRGRLVRVVVGATVITTALFGLRGCTRGGRLEEETKRGKVVNGDPGAEGNFVDFVAERYALPRAFPSNSLADVHRKGPYQSLANIRAALGMPHVSAQWLNSPTPATCTPSCGEGDDCFQGACYPLCASGDIPCGGEGNETFTLPNGACVCIPFEAAPAPPGLCAWASIGPTNIHGRITGLSIDPTNRQRVFASTVGGVWRSTDRGRRWQRVSDDIMSGNASFVAVNPSNPAEVFAGEGDPDSLPTKPGTGIIRSTSGGDPGSWTDVSGTELAGALVFEVLFGPAPTNTIYAATNAGVFTGTHTASGITWSLLGSFFGSVDDIAIDFGPSPPTIYAATETGDIRKWDGVNWNSRTSGIDSASAGRIALGLSPSNPSILYARVTAASGALLGLFKTTTAAEPPAGGGVAWNPDDAQDANKLDDARFPASVGGGGYAWWTNVLAVDPRSPDVVYSGGVNIYKRVAGTPAKWTNITAEPDSKFTIRSLMHEDHHAIVFDPTNPDIVWIGNDGGIFRSTGQSGSWHWETAAHGMVITEDYQVGTQQSFATLVAAGTQDNGTMVTFGNRTWYEARGSDGSYVAVDAKNASTIYGSGGCSVCEIVQPIPFVAPGAKELSIKLPSNFVIGEVPIVTDPSIPGVALVPGSREDAAGNPLSGRGLARTTDGLNWVEILGLDDGGFSSLVISPTAGSTGKKSYYAGVKAIPSIFSSSDEGATWNRAPSGLPDNLLANAIAVDWTNPARAIAAFGGSAGGAVGLTTDNGTSWVTLTATAPNVLPTGAAVTGVAIDPSNPNTIYAATSVGVFKGTLAPATNAVSFIPFDEGLPNGLDINGIWIDRTSSIMTIGSMGHGAYQRDITPGVTCPGAFLVARDNVYDRGVTPSLSGVPDPEHPIPDPARPNFFKPNDSSGGSVYWWDSTDIRIDVPTPSDTAHTIASADNFEFESCPIEVGTNCPPLTLIDRQPVRGSNSTAYVQVTNRGLAAASNVRVVTLFADATLELPQLPANFWTTTFPPNSTSCGAFTPTAGLRMVGCSSIPVVNPELPEVASFAWSVPTDAANHSCMLTVVDSSDDQVPASTRASFDPAVVVPGDRHVALRNLHIVDGPATSAAGGGSGSGGGGVPDFTFGPGGGPPSTPFHGIVDVLVPNRSGTNATISVVVSPTGMTPDGKIQILLPPGIAGKTTGLPPVCGQAPGSGGSSTAVVGIHLPNGVGPDSVVLSADGRLAVADRVTLQESAGGFASLSNMGTTQSTFGTDLKAGSLWSVPSVTLANRDALSGTVRTQGTVTKPSDATVAGGILEHVQLQPGQTVTWNVAIPATSRGNVSLEPGQSQTIVPGRYGTVVVKTNATLKLSAGTYIFGSLDLEPNGTVVLDKAAGQIYVYVQTSLIERGRFLDKAGKLTDVFLGYLGTADAAIGAPFSGVVVAPAAGVTLDTVNAPYTGSFFAKNLQVDPGAVIVHKQFGAFPALTTCSTLDATEIAKAQALGLTTTLFGVPNREITIQTAMTTGQTFRMGFRYESGNSQIDTAARFTALLRRGGAIKGGSTFVLRFN